jgi:hypothetical protein
MKFYIRLYVLVTLLARLESKRELLKQFDVYIVYHVLKLDANGDKQFMYE